MVCCVTLSNLPNLLVSDPFTGVILRAFLAFCLSGNSKAGKQNLGIDTGGICRLLFSFCAWPTSCAEAKAKMDQDREKGGPTGDWGRSWMESLTVQAGWVQPLTGHTEAREDLIFKIMLKVMWRVGAEPGIEPRAFPPSLGLFPLQEASHLRQLASQARKRAFLGRAARTQDTSSSSDYLLKTVIS